MKQVPTYSRNEAGLAEIAAAKAGIIKRGSVAHTAPQYREAMDVLTTTALRLQVSKR